MDSTTTTAAAPGTTSTSSATSSSTSAAPGHQLTRITTGVSVNLNLGANALSIQPIVETIQPIESDDETAARARGEQGQQADHGERLLRKADEELNIVKSFFSRGVGLGLPSGADGMSSLLVQEEDVDVEFQDELSSSCSSSGESYVHVEEDRPPPAAGAGASSSTAPALAATSEAGSSVLAARGVENEVEHQNDEVQLLVRRNAFDHHRAVPMTGIVVGAEGDVGGERSSDDEMMSIPDESPVDCEMAISPMPRSPTAKLLVSREVHRSGATRDESECEEEQEEEAEDPLPAPPAAPRLRPSPAPFALSDIPTFSLSTSAQTNNYRRRRSEPDEEAARQNPPSRRRIDPGLAGEGDGASRRTSIASTVATRTNDEGSGVLEGVDPDSTTPAEVLARPEDLHAGAPSWRSSSASAVSTMSSSLGFFGVLGGAATSSLLTEEPDAMAGDVLGESTRGDDAYRPLPGDHSEADEQEGVDDQVEAERDVEAERGAPVESEVATPSNVASASSRSASALISAAPRQARSSSRRPRSATEIIQNAVTSRSNLERIHEGASRLANLQRRIIERRVIAEQLAAAEQNASSGGTTVAGASGATGGASVVEDSRAANRGPGRQRIYTGSFWEDFRRTRAAATNGSHTNAARTSAGSAAGAPQPVSIAPPQLGRTSTAASDGRTASSLLANRDSSVSVFSDAAGAGPGVPAPAQGGQDQHQVLSAAVGGASSSSSSSTATGSATVTEDITTSGNNRDSDSEMEQQRLLAQRRPRPFSRRGRVNNAPAGAPAPPDVENITTGASSPGTTGTGPRPGGTTSPAAGPRGVDRGAAAASNALAARGESIYGYQSVPRKGDAGRRPRVDFLPDMFVWNEERHRYFPKQSRDAVLTILQVLNYDNCRKRAVLEEDVPTSPRLAGSELRDLLPPKEIWLRHILPCCNKYWFLQPEAQAIKNSPEEQDIISLHGNLPAQVAGADDGFSSAGGGPAASTLLKVDADGASSSQSRGSSTRLNPVSRSNSSSSSSSSLARRHTSLSVEDVDAVTTAERGGGDVLGSDSAVPRDPAIRASSSTTSASSRRPGAPAPLSQRTVCAPEDDNDTITNEPLDGAGFSGTSPQDRGPGLGRRSPSLATTAATLNMPPTPTSLIGSPQYARLTGLSPSAEQTPLTAFATPLATPSHSHTLLMSSTLPPGSTTSVPNPIPEDGPSSTTGTVPFIASTATASTSSSTSSASSPPDPQQPSCVGSTHSPHSRRPPIFETMVSTGKRHQLLLNDPDDDEDDRQGQPQLPPDIVAWIAAAAAHAGLQDEDIPRLFENVNTNTSNTGVAAAAGTGGAGPGAAAARTTGNGPGVGAAVGSGAQPAPNAAP